MENYLCNKLFEICQHFKDRTNIKINYIEYISALLYLKFEDSHCGSFSRIYKERNNYYIADRIDVEIEKIQEYQHDEKLFSNIKFRDLIIHREIGEENPLSAIIHTLNHLLENHDENLGEAYQKLLEKVIAEDELLIDNREFYTPMCITNLVAQLIVNNESLKVLDPVCGSGNFLVSAYKEKNVCIEGIESNINYYNICKTNLLLNQIKNAKIIFDETKTDTDEKFDIVVSNPPFSERKWTHNINKKDYDMLYRFGIKTTVVGDYAYLLMMLNKVKEGGKMAIILPHGALFRNSETEIRKTLIEQNYIEAVIGLPENLFFHNRLPVVILILSKTGTSKDILFVDASKEYVNLKKNFIIPEDIIHKIVDVYTEKENIEEYSYLASKQEIEKNNYDLTIKKYVQIKRVVNVINKDEIIKELNNLNREIEILDENINDVLEAMGKENILNIKPSEKAVNYRRLDYEKMGENLKKARIRNNLTQEELANKLDVSIAFLSRIERGSSHISLNRLTQMCEILNVSPGDILNGAD